MVLVTICCGFVRGDEAFVVADSALTRRGFEPGVEYSSLEEPQSYGQKAVEEGFQKIIRLGTAVVGCSGAVGTIRPIVRHLVEQRVRTGPEILRVLKTQTWERSYGRCELIVAWRDKVAQMEEWNSDEPELTTPSDLGLIVGSRHEDVVSNAVELGTFLQNSRLAANDVLAVYVAGLQAAAVYHKFMALGVGGIHIGALVDASGVRWQKDVITVLYSRPELSRLPTMRRMPTFRWVLSAVREDSAAILSCVPTFEAKLMMGSDREAWIERWGGSLSKQVASFHADYYVFIARDAPLATVVPSPSSGPRTGDFVVEYAGEQMEFILSNRLGDLLLRSPVSRSGRPADLDMSFCGDEMK